MSWSTIALIDTIIKAFQYGGIFIIPLIIAIIIIFKKRRRNQK